MDFLMPLFIWFLGLVMGYIIWAPTTRFKQAFIDGMSFKFLWGKK